MDTQFRFRINAGPSCLKTMPLPPKAELIFYATGATKICNEELQLTESGRRSLSGDFCVWFRRILRLTLWATNRLIKYLITSLLDAQLVVTFSPFFLCGARNA